MNSQMIESGVQLFSRIKFSESDFLLTDINPKLFDAGAPNANEVIEIAGEFSMDLLLDFLIRSVLPKELHTDFKNSGVLFVNTSHHITILKITNVLDAYLKHLQIQNRKPIIEKALSNVTILNCYEEPQIEITFRNLEKVVQDRDNVNLVIIDDITSQFWIARQNSPKLSLEQFSRQNLQLIQNVVKNLNVLLVFSRYQLGNLQKATDLNVSYKIIGEKLDSGKTRFVIIDHIKKITRKVPFLLETFINFS